MGQNSMYFWYSSTFEALAVTVTVGTMVGITGTVVFGASVPTVCPAIQDPGGVVHGSDQVMVTSSYSSVPGGLLYPVSFQCELSSGVGCFAHEKQMVRPTKMSKLSQLAWIDGFHATSSVSVNLLSLRKSAHFSFAFTYFCSLLSLEPGK